MTIFNGTIGEYGSRLSTHKVVQTVKSEFKTEPQVSISTQWLFFSIYF